MSYFVDNQENSSTFPLHSDFLKHSRLQISGNPERAQHLDTLNLHHKHSRFGVSLVVMCNTFVDHSFNLFLSDCVEKWTKQTAVWVTNDYTLEQISAGQITHRARGKHIILRVL